MFGLNSSAKERGFNRGSTHLLATWGIVGFIAAACAVLIGLETSHIFRQRSEILENSRKETTNLTSSLIQHAELIFRSADALLIGMVERLEHEPFGPQAHERLKTWATREVRRIPQYVSFAVIDSEGRMIFNSLEGELKGEAEWPSFNDREYFVYHRAHNDEAIHIGNPIRGRRSEGWLLTVTRRFNHPDGSFRGIAVATINPRFFQDIYDRLELGSNGAVMLATTSGSLLVRRPFVDANVGRDMRGSKIFGQLVTASKGSLEIEGSIDGVRRFNSYEKGNSYPIVIAVAQDVDDLLAPWRQSTMRRLVEIVGIILFMCLLGVIVWRATRNLAKNSIALGETNTRFDAALANMSTGLSMFDADGKLLIWNERYIELYGLPPDIIKRGVGIETILENRKLAGDTHLDIEAYVGGFRQELLDVGQSISTSRLKDGRTISVAKTAITSGGWVAIHEDITDRVSHDQALFEQATELARTNMRFDAALSTMTQGLCMFDENRQLVVWNDRYAEMYQVSPELLKVGTSHEALVIDRLSRGVVKGNTSASAVEKKLTELTQLPTDASWIDELSNGRFIQLIRQPLEGGGWLSTLEDITERRRAEAEIIHLARHDVLTGLANRAQFNEKLDEASKRLKRNGNTVTVLMLDLDKFKAVNDTLGHPAGDQLLIEVARRLQSIVRETDLLARLGGDEFAIIQEGGASQYEGAIALALRIIKTISEPFDLKGHQANIGASVGIAMAPDSGVEPEELLKSADLALYDVKAGGRNDFRIYHPAMAEVMHSQQSAETELREAIAREEFELHYQPMVDVKTRGICGLEALIRWRHPAKGLMMPDQFIPLAESTGLIVPLGEWILQKACRDAASLPAHLKLSVNISEIQFKNGNLFEIVLCTLLETGLAPERLELEIAETSLPDAQQAHLSTRRQLKNLGVSIALDDFGTGYSSVTNLTGFPFDTIKIDETCTQGAPTRRDCAAVVSSALAVAASLGIKTSAEGIETEEQFDYMRKAGIDLAQGYLFGRPLPLSQLDLAPAASRRKMTA